MASWVESTQLATANSGAPINVGAPVFGPRPRSEASLVTREIIIGLVVAVVSVVILKRVKF